VQDLLHQTGSTADSDGTIAGRFLQIISLAYCPSYPINRRACDAICASVSGRDHGSPLGASVPALARNAGAGGLCSYRGGVTPGLGFSALRDTLRNLQLVGFLPLQQRTKPSSTCARSLRDWLVAPGHRRLASPRSAELYLNWIRTAAATRELRAVPKNGRSLHGGEMIVDWDLDAIRRRLF